MGFIKDGTRTMARDQHEEGMGKLVFGELLFDEILVENTKTFPRWMVVMVV